MIGDPERRLMQLEGISGDTQRQPATGQLRLKNGRSTVDEMISRTGARGRARYVPDDTVNQRVSRSVTGN
jgi:hypothetical protein